uniref:Uncharacterized protein n=1 Tax=Parascaris equorum TaxID=6256 RepID=A0A914RCB7_PAREQ
MALQKTHPDLIQARRRVTKCLILMEINRRFGDTCPNVRVGAISSNRVYNGDEHRQAPHIVPRCAHELLLC